MFLITSNLDKTLLTYVALFMFLNSGNAAPRLQEIVGPTFIQNGGKMTNHFRGRISDGPGNNWISDGPINEALKYLGTILYYFDWLPDLD